MTMDPHPSLHLTTWLQKSSEIDIPADFESKESQEKCEQQINQSCQELFSLFKQLPMLDKIDAWFRDLQSGLSPQQQMKHLFWLGGILAHCTLDRSVQDIFHPEANHALSAVGKLTAPLLQTMATDALISLYKTGNQAKRSVFEELAKEKQPDHLTLTGLLMINAGIALDKTKQLLKKLSPKYYENKEVINSINELAGLLGQNDFSPDERFNLLQFSAETRR